jgi:hypothetical protein
MAYRAALVRNGQGASQRSLLGLLVLFLVGSGCAHVRVADYVFGAEGIVTDPTGAPIEGVRVSLAIGGDRVYEVIKPVHERIFTTDPEGRFRFMYTAHDRATPYCLRFEKEGYISESVSSLSPPLQRHLVRLARAAASNVSQAMLSNNSTPSREDIAACAFGPWDDVGCRSMRQCPGH